VQEAFLKLYLQFRKNAELKNVRAWVFEVARNCLRDARKSARNRLTVELGDAVKHERYFVDPSGDPERGV
jgi:DNA-directed RNA polymerase specialized sigma24 family protein